MMLLSWMGLMGTIKNTIEKYNIPLIKQMNENYVIFILVNQFSPDS